MITFKSRYYRLVTESLWFFLLMLVVFTAARFVFIGHYVGAETLSHNADSLPTMFFNGLRYDVQTISYFLLPSVVYFIVESVVNLFVKKRKYAGLTKFNFWYFPISMILALIVLIVDHQFYANFNTHISIVFFDFLNEKPLLLLKTMWLENHLGWVLVALVVWGSLVSFVFNRILAQKAKPTKLKNYLSWLYLPLLFLFLRGSLGTFPLRLENCYVSTDMEINACTPNGFFR
jgi:hypothetical protein